MARTFTYVRMYIANTVCLIASAYLPRFGQLRDDCDDEAWNHETMSVDLDCAFPLWSPSIVSLLAGNLFYSLSMYTLIQLQAWWMASTRGSLVFFLRRLASPRVASHRVASHRCPLTGGRSSLVSFFGDRSGLSTVTSCLFFSPVSSSCSSFSFSRRFLSLLKERDCTTDAGELDFDREISKDFRLRWFQNFLVIFFARNPIRRRTFQFHWLCYRR